MCAAGLPTRVEVQGGHTHIPATAQLTVYRLVQEALTNTVKHAYASCAQVELHWGEDELTLTVTDDGRIYGIFRTCGYPEAVAHTLTALTTNVVAFGIFFLTYGFANRITYGLGAPCRLTRDRSRATSPSRRPW